MNRPLRLGLALAGLVTLAACGSDGGSAATTEVPAATAAPDTNAAPDTTTAIDTTGGPATSAAPATADAPETADAGTFPVTVEHKYGETTIDAEPQRVVSVGFADQDFILSLGVTPIAVRDWYGDQPFATWPWAQDELGDAEPVVLPSTELNFEQIAQLDPDLIVGVSSGMTDEEYATLSAIAPTIAQSGDYHDYGMPWDAALLQIGAALGRSPLAETVVADTRDLFDGVRDEHPEFAGATVSVAFFFEEQPGAYASGDSRSNFMTDLGFVVPPEFDDLAGDAFYFSISQEELATLDTDVIVWLATTPDVVASIAEMPLRPTLDAYADGREILADPLLGGAFSFSSPLSIEYVLDELVPELALALDGDPTTVVPSAAALYGDGPASGGDELDATAEAAADAWALVFDSAAPIEDKLAHLEDAAALTATLEAYASVGSSMGGITLAPTDVVVDGDVATVTYDVLFGGTAAYSALTGTITSVDGTWVVSRAEFCGFMASARNACPT